MLRQISSKKNLTKKIQATICTLALVLGSLMGMVPVYGQSPGAPVEVSEVKIVLADSGSAGMGNMGGMGNMATMAAGSSNMMSGEKTFLQVSVQCKNNIDKEVKTIFWEASFTNAKQQVVTKQFKTSKKIKNGKQEKLEEDMEYDTSLLPKSLKFGYRIVKIEYSDKSTWENSASGPDSFSYKVYNL
jgi:hypothetical protein